jgi:hypothetical protein
MHEYYSADLSIKVKSAKRIQMMRGDNIVAAAIYGYRKNSLGKWEPDPVPAEVVRLIFKMALDGNSTSQIRDKLCAERYPTPKEYIELKRGKDIDPQCVWTARMIQRTIANVQYTGSYVSGKQQSKAIGSSSKINTDKSEWIIIPDSHPPLVSKGDFAAAQGIMGKYKNFCTVKPTGNLLLEDEGRPKRDRMISGERMPNNPIYGYVKDADGNLAIDVGVADVISNMYQLALQGFSFREIRDKLTQAGHPIPTEHIRIGKGHDISPTCQWTVKSVRGILKNIQYTGAYVSGKILKNYDTGKKYHTAQSDWVIIPDKNPPIVSKEVFDEVQETIKSAGAKRKNARQHDNLLSGNIVKCGCCGYALSYDEGSNSAVYRCHHTLADTSAECNRLKVGVAELDEVVLTIIRKQAEVVLNSDDLSALRIIGTDGRQAADYDKEINLCLEQRQQAYERFILNEIDRDTYQSLRAECAGQLEKLNGQKALFKQIERDRQSSIQTADIAKHALSGSVTPREIVKTLFERVFVFPDKRIEVLWKFADFAKTDRMHQ